MELLREHLEVEVSGPVLGQFQLGINEADFKLAMDILMDLYTDPIGSVVREVASNARDALNAAGKHDIPIEVTLPTPLSPYLVIRDRGSGMTQDFITNTYGKLLSSTKRYDNEGIGGYGIGSKSPLGYTDSYTFSTRVNGEELHVHVSRGGGFTSLGTNPTTEDDGTTVTVPVKGSDCKAFSDATEWLRYMDPPPLINGTPMVKEEVLLEGDNWFMAKHNTPYNTDPCILLGPIPYPLDLNKLGSGISGHMRAVGEAKYLRLKFPIGSLTVTPSRETLRYDEHTVKAIRAALNAAYAPCLTAINKMLDSCEWKVNSRVLCYQYSLSNWSRWGNLSNKYQDSTYLPKGEKWHLYTYVSWKNSVICETVTYYPSNGAEVYLHDRPARSKMRIHAYLKSSNNKDLRLLVGPLESAVVGENLFPTQLLSTLPDIDYEEEEVVDEEEGTTVKVRKKPVDRVQKGNIRVKEYTFSATSPDRVLLYAHTQDAVMPLDGEGHYVSMLAGKVQHPDVLRDFQSHNIDQMLSILGVADKPLYVVTPQQVERLGPGWKDLVTCTNEYVTPWLSWVKQLHLAVSPPMSLYRLSITDDLSKELGITGYLLEYLKLSQEANKFIRPKGNTFWSRVLDLYQNHLCQVWQDIPVIPNTPLDELRYLVMKVYPLLDSFRVDSEEMRHYLNIIDENLNRGDGWYSSCKLTEGVPQPTMSGKELMIHYYGDYGDVRGYYNRYGDS